MADRSVKVSLLADVRGFISGVQQASAASEKLATDLAGHAAENSAAWEEVGGALVAVGIASGTMAGAAVTAFARFDAQMSQVQASTNASAAVMDQLGDAAIQAGAETAFSATEAAEGIEELSKAGVSAADILGGALSGSLDLAAAGGLEVGDAAEIAATAMTQFGLAGDQVTHIADLLAAGAGNAQGSVSDLGQALGQSGQVAKQTGLSVEETTGALSAFASAGLLGSDAGTSFKSMLQRLTPQSLEAKNLMDELGISAYDAQGQFVGLTQFAGNLQESLRDLTPEQRNAALATIFGSDAVRAASVIYEEGAAGVQKWIGTVNDSGYAAEQAAAKLDNLKGDLEAFGGSVETALIGLGEAGNGPLREIVQDATSLINVFSGLPEPVQQGTLMMLGITAAVGLAGGAFLVAAPKVIAFNAALSTMGVAGARAAAALTAVKAAAGPIGLALTVVTLAGAKLLNGFIDQRQEVDNYAASLDELTGSVTDATRNVAALSLQKAGALTAARQLGIDTAVLTRAVTGEADALSIVRDRLDEVRNRTLENGITTDGSTYAFIRQREAAKAVSEALGEQTETLTAARERQLEVATATGSVSEATNKAAAEHREASGAITVTGMAAGGTASEMAGLATETVSAEDALNALDAALAALFERELGVQEATDATEQAIYEMAEASRVARDQGAALTGGLTENSQAARDNRAAINDAMRTIAEEAEARVRSGESIGSVTGRIYASRDALIAEAMSRGASRAEAEAYTDSLREIPTAIATTVSTPGLERAKADAEFLRLALANIPKSVRVDVATYATTIRQDIAAANRNATAQADGGIVGYADGGITAAANGLSRDSRIVRGGSYGRGILWAEPETGWEAYISGKPGKEARNVGILSEVADRFGLALTSGTDRNRYGTPVGAGAGRSGVGPAPTVVHKHYTFEGFDADGEARARRNAWRAIQEIDAATAHELVAFA